jgi:hypothetical protein
MNDSLYSSYVFYNEWPSNADTINLRYINY